MNTCEHGDHPAPEGKRFCSTECKRCEAGERDCGPCAAETQPPPDRVCRSCLLTDAVKCDRCGRWVCSHYGGSVALAGVLGGGKITSCDDCAGKPPLKAGT